MSQFMDMKEMEEEVYELKDRVQERNDSRLSRLEQDLGASNAEESEIN